MKESLNIHGNKRELSSLVKNQFTVYKTLRSATLSNRVTVPGLDCAALDPALQKSKFGFSSLKNLIWFRPSIKLNLDPTHYKTWIKPSIKLDLDPALIKTGVGSGSQENLTGPQENFIWIRPSLKQDLDPDLK